MTAASFHRSRDRLMEVRNRVRLLTEDVDKLLDDLKVDGQLPMPLQPQQTHTQVRQRPSALSATGSQGTQGVDGALHGVSFREGTLGETFAGADTTVTANGPRSARLAGAAAGARPGATWNTENLEETAAATELSADDGGTRK